MASTRKEDHTSGVGKTRDEQSLATILSITQRGELTLLLANIIELMRRTLLDNFDAKAGLDQSLVQRNGMSDTEKLMASDPGRPSVEEYDKQRKLQEEYETDINSTRMKQLKQNALNAFDEWSQRVISRVGEVVNSRETAKQQLQRTMSGTGVVTENVEESNEQIDTDPKPAHTSMLRIGKITGVPESSSTIRLRDLYPSIKNPLTKLSMDQRTLVLHSVLLLILSLENYNARSRVLMLHLCSSLEMPLKTFAQDEYAVAKGLLEGVKELTAEEETKKKVESSKESRRWKVGIATVGGAALIGVTGGLAAPLVAAGIGSLMGGLGLGATSAAAYLGSVAGSTYLVGGLFGAYGGRMTGKMMDNYAQEVEDFQFLPLHSDQKTHEDDKTGAQQASDHDHKLRVSIVISGWLTEQEDVVKPWRVLGTGSDAFALKYALEAMLNLGNAMNGLVQSAAWGYAKKKIIAQTILADLAVAMWPIGLMKAARVVDNPFNIAKSRSEKAGEVLADALINRAQGERPVSLVGYSLGARVIYSCLNSLAKRNAFGLVESAVLIGAPTPSDTSDWRMLRAVVSGRLVNVYSANDYVLGFMYRTSSLQYGVAGLQPIQGVPHVENVDVSEEVNGHLQYRFLIGSILKKIGFEDIDTAAVEEEKEALLKMQEDEKQDSLNAQRKRLLRRESAGGREDEAAEAEQEASEIEKEIQEKTQKSMVTQALEYLSVPKILNKSSTETPQQPAQTIAKKTETGKPSPVDASGQNFAQRAYEAIPSLLQMGRSSHPAETKAGQTEQSQRAAGSYRNHLPSLHKNLPSVPREGSGKKSS